MKSTFRNHIASGWLRAAFLVAIIPSAQQLWAQARMCKVPGTYNDLQSAINDSSCWDIVLAAQTYNGNFTISRNVQIIGAGPAATVVDGNLTGEVFHITTGSVHLEGMTIQNGYYYSPAGQGDFWAVDNSYGGTGPLTIVNTVFTKNSGAVISNGDTIIADSAVYGNFGLAGKGGTIDSPSGTLYLIRSSVYNNSTQYGAVEGGNMYVTQSTIASSGNILIETWGNLYVSSSTLADNWIGLALDGGASVTLKGSIIANNSYNCYYDQGTYHDGGGNFQSPPRQFSDCNVTTADLKLGPLQYNGGPSPAFLTMLPQGGSPVIGQGACTDTSNIGLVVDQRYRVRPASGCDAGAVDTHATVDGHPDALWWRLNEGSGSTVYDSSPHGLDGFMPSYGGGSPWLIGSAGFTFLTSTGSLNTSAAWLASYPAGTYSYAPATTQSNNVTVSLWVNGGGSASANDMVPFYVGRYGVDGYGLQIRQSDRHVLLAEGLNGNYEHTYDFGWALPITGWIHLALVRTSAGSQLYVNGFATGATLPTSYWNPSYSTSLGADSFGGHNFEGYVDDFRVYNRALSAEEIYHLATADGAFNYPLPPGTYTIQNLNSGLVLGVSGTSMSEGAPIVQWDNYSHPDQKWTLTPVGNGAYTLTDVNSGLVIGVSGARARL